MKFNSLNGKQKKKISVYNRLKVGTPVLVNGVLIRKLGMPYSDSEGNVRAYLEGCSPLMEEVAIVKVLKY